MLTSVVVPVYNESACLGRNIETLHSFLKTRFPADFEILIVDDGSQDDSLQIAKALAGRLNLSISAIGRNRGKGAAIRKGMLESRGDIVFFSDADLSTPLEEMDRFLAYIESGADVVIGNRKSTKARITRLQPPHRIVMGLGYTYLVNLMLGMRISDYTCGFKGFSRMAVDALFPKTRIDGWSFDVEVLYLARRLGLTIREVPVTWENRPNSKVRLLKATIQSFREVLKVRQLHRQLKASPAEFEHRLPRGSA